MKTIGKCISCGDPIYDFQRIKHEGCPTWGDSQVNKCCLHLEFYDCGDTEEHGHLICGFSKRILSNSTVIEICLAGFSKCVSAGGEQEYEA